MCDVRHGRAIQGLPRGKEGVAGVFMHCDGVHMIFSMTGKHAIEWTQLCFRTEKSEFLNIFI